MKPDFGNKQPTRLSPKTAMAIDAHRKAIKRDTGKTPSINATINEMILFTAGFEKACSNPIDYEHADMAIIEDYIIHGYDYTIRAAAFAEFKRRMAGGMT